MTSLDKQYLSLQFRDKVHQKNATEFQSFFEEIAQKAFKDFQKVRPCGNQGDGGNDGYRPSEGIYYQVYAPKDPKEKDANAAKKFKSDFATLKKHWDQISKIKLLNFVFNDKYSGTSIKLEEAKAELEKENEDIGFKIFSTKDLEQVFFTLDSDQIASLGFDIDSRNAIKIAREHLVKLEIELDRGNVGFVLKTLENIKSIIEDQGDDNLLLDYEIIEAKALQKCEKVKEARERYENIFKRYPKDPRAPLLLAEIYLNTEDFKKNEELLKQAEEIEADYWLLHLEKLIREYRLGNKIDISKIDEQSFPKDPRVKSDYYRIYSLFIERAENYVRAKSFVERAIHFNPDKFSNHDVKLSLLESEFLSRKDNKEKNFNEGMKLLDEIENVRQRFAEWGGPGIRNRVFLNIKKLPIFFNQENLPEFEKNAKETFELVIECYFDQSIDKVLTDLLRFIELPQDDFAKLLNYLKDAEKSISDTLAKVIILQFIHKSNLFTDGKKFFEKIDKKEVVKFINDLKNKNYDKVLPFIQKDIQFAVNFAVMAKSFSELRRKIIETLPNDGSIQKEKLFLLLNYDEGDIDEAFSILKSLDLSKLSYIECRPTLKIAEKKKAWDFVIILLNKLLQHEKDSKSILQAKLKLFSANLNLERFPEAIRIGENILSNTDEIKILDDENKEILLAQTIYARLHRGEYPQAKKLVQDHGQFLKTFVGKISTETEIYLKSNEPQKALDSLIEAVKILKRPSPEEYGSLYLIFTEIGNLMDFPLVSLNKVEANSFIKLKDQETWLFIGDGNELDAIKIPHSNKASFLNKKLGEKIVFADKYRSEKNEQEIENILPIEKYVLWQSLHNAQKLSVEGLWDKMWVIEVPKTETGIDTKYLIARLEDEKKKGEKFFETYCQQNIPLALLVVSEGGLTNAIGRIMNEQKGFIHSSNGTMQEMESQKEVARQIIDGQQFYVDGTSALILSETGLLEKIYKFLPNLKIPQSVISLLLEVIDKFRYRPGQVGSMYFSQGKIGFSSIDSSKREAIQSNFEKSINIFESKSQGVEIISSANKSDAFSEQKVPASLCDACILAQRDNIPILTEDFLYLQMNEIETKKKAPKYCSAFAIIRVLYEQGKIDFSEYLNFFVYLSSYRFRFLPIMVEDLEKAVFGDGVIKTINTEELRKFNFPLTLSEEYGVPKRTASLLVGRFLMKLLIDDAILPEMAEGIFSEIISAFPTQDKKSFGKFLLVSCVQAINKNSRGIVLGTRVQEKIDLLSQFIQIYDSGGLIIPKHYG